MIFRKIEGTIEGCLQKGKVLVLYGPRQVGKTTLAKNILSEYEGRVFSGVGEDATLRAILESESVNKIRSSFSGYDLIFIDEAQKVDQIGLGLKILIDHQPSLKVFATGSSSFELANQIGEPLTGRKITFTLYPIAVTELLEHWGRVELSSRLEELLIYGSYPEVITSESREEKERLLLELRDGYLFRDILELENIRYSRKLLDLLRLLAFQIGQEVSLSELGNSLDLSKQSVARYLDLLEKSFVIKNIRGFSRNLRKEITKTSRFYFLDNGIRNAVISNFNFVEQRNDVGQLWENFLFVERLKAQHYFNISSNNYFWRTYDQQEIDLVEERGGKLFGYEFKYKKGTVKAPKSWKDAYPSGEFRVIHQENFIDFLNPSND